MCVKFPIPLQMKLEIFHVLLLLVVAFILTIVFYHHYSSVNNEPEFHESSPSHKNQLSSQQLYQPAKSNFKVFSLVPFQPVSSNHSSKVAEVFNFNVDHLPTSRSVSLGGSSSTWKSYRMPGGVSWNEFVKYPLEPFYDSSEQDVQSLARLKSLKLHECDMDMVQSLAKPGLSKSDYEWCKWALSNDGGRVKVGKSYGNLGSKDREKYENKNCNAVAKGVNPSCDDAWGDALIRNWRNNPAAELCGSAEEFSSRVKCWDSSSQARFCVFENVVMDFSKMKDIARPSRSTGSRKWEKGFLHSHCDRKHDNINYFDFYQSGLDPSRARCDYVLNETVLAFSHDDIHNLGHSMSDFMNVWSALWLAGISEYQQQVTFLNIDAIRQGHNYHDELFSFKSHYKTAFARILQAKSFGSSRVCFKRVVMQPKPLILFTWDGWWQPMKCSFVGPSTLFQRWNLHIRNNYGLLNEARMPTNKGITLLLVVRQAKGIETSRVFANPSQLQSALRSIYGVTVVVQDLSLLSFTEQVHLVASSSIVIGMHGAGIASSMHMAVGTKYCCGVIEIFPRGEYSPIFGYGNMARRMGHYYERLDLTSEGGAGGGGTHVPTESVVQLANSIIDRIKSNGSTCIHPSAIADPHFASLS